MQQNRWSQKFRLLRSAQENITTWLWLKGSLTMMWFKAVLQPCTTRFDTVRTYPKGQLTPSSPYMYIYIYTVFIYIYTVYMLRSMSAIGNCVQWPKYLVIVYNGQDGWTLHTMTKMIGHCTQWPIAWLDYCTHCPICKPVWRSSDELRPDTNCDTEWPKCCKLSVWKGA